MAAESIRHYLEEEIMSEDPIEYVPDPDAFSLEMSEPEEYTDEELIDELMAKMSPLPVADDDAPKNPCKCHRLPMLPRGYRYAAISADIYGRASLGKIFGFIFSAMNIGSAVGVYIAGLDYDITGNYHLSLLANGFLGGRTKTKLVEKEINTIDVLVSEDDDETMNLLIADEGTGPFAQIDTTGKMRFDSGELAMIGHAADAMIQWLSTVDQDNG